MIRPCRAYAPASIGNLAAGFDSLGAALAPLDGSRLGDEVALAPADRPSLRCEGPFASQLPADPDQNLAWAAVRAFEARLGRPVPPLTLTLSKNLPVGSGLGSSATTIVATLVALNHTLGAPLDPAALLEAAGEAECGSSGGRHLDNVAPALLGGLRLLSPDGAALALPWPEDLRLVVASPDFSLTTREARAVLPAQVPLSLAVDHGRNLATLVHALHTGDTAHLRLALRDLLAEPHRAALVRGFRGVQQAALEAGALGCSLSGAGPAVFAVAWHPDLDAVGAAMAEAWARQGVATRLHLCALAVQGARILEEA